MPSAACSTQRGRQTRPTAPWARRRGSRRGQDRAGAQGPWLRCCWCPLGQRKGRGCEEALGRDKLSQGGEATQGALRGSSQCHRRLSPRQNPDEHGDQKRWCCSLQPRARQTHHAGEILTKPRHALDHGGWGLRAPLPSFAVPVGEETPEKQTGAVLPTPLNHGPGFLDVVLGARHRPSSTRVHAREAPRQKQGTAARARAEATLTGLSERPSLSPRPPGSGPQNVSEK